MVSEIIYCFIATLFFAQIMNAPKKSLIYSSLTAATGYALYKFCIILGQPILGFFSGTCLVAVIGEILARRLKMPATIFIFPGVIPIVPGLGLYETILAFVQNDVQKALETGAATILSIGSMAIAMALVSLIALKVRKSRTI
ncbi:threonine/serine exporter family protein [Sedimentibacter sp.]|uniref:threonine/serine exporter family protein n=1 Tax=Sedimentibacter sp. TaxID=1960295 RepID=UPI00289C9AF8|nr:threonine/serine exporter family protein [Sedimentibacter sp.]